jgi:hypothetical protein
VGVVGSVGVDGEESSGLVGVVVGGGSVGVVIGSEGVVDGGVTGFGALSFTTV